MQTYLQRSIFWGGCFLCSGHHSNTVSLWKLCCKPHASEAQCSECRGGFKDKFRCSSAEKFLLQFLKKMCKPVRESHGKEFRRIRKINLWIRLGVLRDSVISSRILDRSTCVVKCIILLENQNKTGVARWDLAVWLLHLQACAINITTGISRGEDTATQQQ